MSLEHNSTQSEEVGMCSEFVQKEILTEAMSDPQPATCDNTSPTCPDTEQVSGNSSKSLQTDSVSSLERTKSSISLDLLNESEMTDLEQQVLDSVLQELPQLVDHSDVDVIKLGPRPTAASLGLKESIEECMKVTEPEGGS